MAAPVFLKQFIQDINMPIKVRNCGGLMFTGDSLADTISVSMYDGTNPYAISGTVTCNCIRADGATVPVTGSVSGNTAQATLTQACCAIQGPLAVIMKITSGSTTTSILKAVYTVDLGETGTVVDPGTIISNVTALISAIQTAVDSIPADYSALLAAIAPNYDNLTYPVVPGQYCWHGTLGSGGGLYKAKQTIASAETWTASHWTASVITGDILDINRAVALSNTQTIILESGTYSDSNGTTKTAMDDRARNVTPIPLDNFVSLAMPDGYSMYLFLLDKDFGYIKTLTWSTYRTRNEFGDAAYINFGIKNSAGTSVVSDIATIQSGIKFVTARQALKADNDMQNVAFRDEIGVRLTPDSVATGYALHYDGTCSLLSGFDLLKYQVTAGENIFVFGSVDNSETWQAVYQFQSAESVPTSSNTNVVGRVQTSDVKSYITVPAGATWLIICAASTNTKAGVYDIGIRATVNANHEQMLDITGDITDGVRGGYTLGHPTAEPGSWKLSATGNAASDSSYKLIKYAVTAGDTIYLRATSDGSAGVWQWQSAASVPGTGNMNIVGTTKTTAYNGFVEVPTGATYVIISALKTNKVSGVYFPPINYNTMDIVDKYINNDTLTDIKSVQAIGNDRSNTAKKFVFFSDIHAGSVNYDRMFEFCKGLGEGAVDAIINGGDTVQSLLSDSVQWYDTANDSNSSLNVLTCVGNHDVWEDWWVVGNPVTIYNKFTAPVESLVDVSQPSGASTNGLNYYYKDYGNIRVIVLAAMVVSSTETMLWTADQKTWLESVLADANDEENPKSVICVSHAPYAKSKAVIDPDLPLNSWRDYVGDVGSTIFDNIHLAQDAVDAVHTFIQAGGEFICWLTGHTHQDMVMTESDYGDQFMINIASAKYYYHSDGYSPAETEYNARGYDCFDYIGVDTTNKMIKVWRIGYNEDASMRIRNRFAYDYKNLKILSYS